MKEVDVKEIEQITCPKAEEKRPQFPRVKTSIKAGPTIVLLP
jgi:hypothetical protein